MGHEEQAGQAVDHAPDVEPPQSTGERGRPRRERRQRSNPAPPCGAPAFRRLVVEEANAIGTAWLRLDLLAPAARDSLRSDFRRYLDARLAAYEAVPNLALASEKLQTAGDLQRAIWKGALAACRAEEQTPPTLLLLPAINAMIDITGEREMAVMTHPPPVIFMLLFVLALLSALLVGIGMSSTPARSRLHMWVFATLTSLVIYVIVDLEYPRLGLIRIDAADQLLTELRQQQMK